MPITIGLLTDEELQASDHPHLNIRLIFGGLTPDPTGHRPPRRLEIRVSPKALTRLSWQIRAIQHARCIHARSRAQRKAEAQTPTADGRRGPRRDDPHTAVGPP